jgi:type I restriction enzyme S subunit
MNVETFLEKFDEFAGTPDAVAKLRELILRLAVQGRLVDPDDDDEPVTAFLRRIWAASDGKIVEIVEEEKVEPFKLPAHWRWVVLAEVAEFSIGKTPPRADSSYWYPEDHNWVSIADMKHYGTITETKEKVSELAAQDVFRQRFAEPGSILMSFKLTIGKVARAGIRCFHNEAIISVLPPDSELADYLFRFLPIFAALQTSNNAIKGSTLNKGLLTWLPIALPPLAEQKRIVAKVDELMALCDRLEAQQAEREAKHAVLARAALARFAEAPTPANLEYLFHPSFHIDPADLRKAILAMAVRGTLVEQDPKDKSAQELLATLNETRASLAKAQRVRLPKPVPEVSADDAPHPLPDSWAWCRIGQIALVVDYGTSHKADLNVAEVPVYRMGNIVGGKVVNDNLKYVSAKIDDLPGLYLKNEDILFNRTNSYELVGKSGLYKGEDDVATFASYLIRIRVPSAYILPEFITLAMNSPYYRATQIEPEVVQQCGQANFNGSKLSATVVPLPPLAEQRRIVTKVDALMALVDRLEAQLAESRSRAGLLMEAVVAELTTQG